MDKSFKERKCEQLRLLILSLLSDQDDYTATDAVLYEVVEKELLLVAMSDLRMAMSWLNEEGLVVTQRAGGKLGFTVATITERGMDVANGARTFPGVAKRFGGA